MVEIVVSIDPGITTGFAIGQIGKDYFDIGYSEAVLEVEELLRLLNEARPTIIICEDFEFRRGQRDNLELFSVQLIGIVRLYGRQHGNRVQVFLQKAAWGKSYFTNEKLKDLNVYLRGLDHGRDACRHLLQWYTFGPGYRHYANCGPPKLSPDLVESLRIG